MSYRSNRYKGICQYCQKTVGANRGYIERHGSRWLVAHFDCEPGHETGQSARVSVTTFSSGQSVYRNTRGICEDAPCCGCCS